MGLLNFLRNLRRKKTDPTYGVQGRTRDIVSLAEVTREFRRAKGPELAPTIDKPWACPRCGSRIEKFAGVEFTEKSPAPIKEGWSIAGVIPESSVQVEVDGKVKREPIPAKCILVKPHVVDENVTYVCLGLKNREEVDSYLAPDYPRGNVPASCVSAPPCGWTGAESDYGTKWI